MARSTRKARRASYQFEYGLEDCRSSTCAAMPGDAASGRRTTRPRSIKVTGLKAGTTYHYRLVAENQSGSAAGADIRSQRSRSRGPRDPCPNAHVRQQTSAALLLDCRHTSWSPRGTLVDMTSSRTSCPARTRSTAIRSRRAEGSLRRARRCHTRGPAIRPTTGGDPYIATRGDDGWSTQYVGISADQPIRKSPLRPACSKPTRALDSFAFGGEGSAHHALRDGSTNIPLRPRGGSLIEGMAGSQSPEPAEPAGEIGRYLSADGAHLVFGSTTKLEPAGNENGDVTIYEPRPRSGRHGSRFHPPGRRRHDDRVWDRRARCLR